MEQNKNKEVSQNTFTFIEILFKNWLYIVMALILGALAFLGYSIINIKPTYTASRSYILRTTMADGTQANQATLAKRYFSTVEKLIISPNTLSEVNSAYKQEQIDDGVALEDIEYLSSGNIGVVYQDNSLIFKIKYTDISQAKAIEKLSVLVETFRYSDIFKDGIMATEVQLIETQQNGVVERNTVYAKYTALGAIVGFAVSIVIITAIYVFDNKIRDKKEYEELTGVSVIAYIAKEKGPKEKEEE